MSNRKKIISILKSKKIFVPILIFINWLSQSIFGMDKTEKIARLLIEFIFFIIIFTIFYFFIEIHIIISLIIGLKPSRKHFNVVHFP